VESNQIKFEYHTHYDDGFGLDQFKLNELGSEGWELVAVVMADTRVVDGRYRYYFKRERK
jgi:hypothetical protein